MSRIKRDNHSYDSFAIRHPRINRLFGFVILVGLVAFALFVISRVMSSMWSALIWLIETVSKLDAVVIVALLTGSVSLVSVVISSIVAKIIDYRSARKNYLAQKREKPYMAFVEMVYKIQKNAKENGSYPSDEMLDDIRSFSQELTLWGSPRVARKWIDFRLKANSPEEAKDKLYLLEDIMNEMRNDIGVKRMKKGNLLSFFINDIDENK